jgi:hypothetical protein
MNKRQLERQWRRQSRTRRIQATPDQVIARLEAAEDTAAELKALRDVFRCSPSSPDSR